MSDLSRSAKYVQRLFVPIRLNKLPNKDEKQAKYVAKSEIVCKTLPLHYIPIGEVTFLWNTNTKATH